MVDELLFEVSEVFRVRTLTLVSQDFCFDNGCFCVEWVMAGVVDILKRVCWLEMCFGGKSACGCKLISFVDGNVKIIYGCF